MTGPCTCPAARRSRGSRAVRAYTCASTMTAVRFHAVFRAIVPRVVSYPDIKGRLRFAEAVQSPSNGALRLRGTAAACGTRTVFTP
jgi:hypothetical protein